MWLGSRSALQSNTLSIAANDEEAMGLLGSARAQEPQSWWQSLAGAGGSGSGVVFFDEAARERLRRVRAEFPLLPPLFETPRGRGSSVEALSEGPNRFELQELRLKHAIAQSDKVGARKESPEEFMEDMQLAACTREMTRRRRQTGFVRLYGCQVFLCSIAIGGILVVWYRYNDGRKATVLFDALVAVWSYAIFMFFCSWVKAVVQTCDIVFLYLARTFNNVQHSGDIIALRIRRTLLLRVLGLVHCRRDELVDLSGRVDWDKGFQEFLEAKHANFPASRFAKDGTVETGCLFLDAEGELQRFVWKLERSSPTGGAAMVTKVLSTEGTRSELRDPRWVHWACRPLDHVLDLQADSVEAIIKQHPWWETLEFRLHSEQHKLVGFRSYLGSRFFNAESRLVFYLIAITMFCVCLCAAMHITVVAHDPFIFANKYQLIPHIGTALGFGITLNIIGTLSQRARFSRRVLNMVMYALEKQVNKDWGLIMGAVVVEDPASYLQRPELCSEVKSIPELWQIVSCDESLEAIAQSMQQHTQSATRALSYKVKGTLNRLF